MPTNSSGTNLDSFAGPKGKRSEDVYKSSPREGLWRVAEKMYGAMAGSKRMIFRYSAET